MPKISRALLVLAILSLITLDLWFRLHTPAMQLGSAPQQYLLTHETASLKNQTPLPPAFDLFFTDVRSQLLDNQNNELENEEKGETLYESYHLLAIRTNSDESLRAIIELSKKTPPDAIIMTVGEGETLGQARILAIESRSILLESPSRGQFQLHLFEPVDTSDQTNTTSEH
ncbi:hypothetical protein [Pontibacterium sp.]|uniref:hypothetical protein n=1 Tax=Pontibacterium sp. TaxID=2036026 RepID=UPI0035689A1F